MTTTIITQITDTANALLRAIGSFRQEQINTVPFAGSWTAGQVGEHLRLSASGVLGTICGPGKVAERDPEEKVAPIENLFLDFTIKMTSRDFIRPSDDRQDKEKLLLTLRRILDGITEIAQTKDLTEICVIFDMPGFGPLTRLEWIAFILAHIRRHVRQLYTISEKLNGRILN